jgi:hypothetical protein
LEELPIRGLEARLQFIIALALLLLLLLLWLLEIIMGLALALEERVGEESTEED